MKLSDHILPLSLLAAGLLAGCSGDGDVAGPAPSRDVIRLSAVDAWQDLSGTSRSVTLYGGASPLTAGDFRLSAYTSGSGKAYFTGERVSYGGTPAGWCFGGGRQQYWPQDEKLDLVAFMPYDAAGTPVAPSGISFSPSSGPSFSVSLPSSSAGQDGLHELLYAYEPGKSRTDDGGRVSLTFRHPFASAVLKLSKAHPGITIHSVTFKDVMTSGTYSHQSQGWSGLGTPSDFTVSVGGTFGDEQASYPLAVSGPFLLLPQQFPAGVKVAVSYTEDGVADTKETTLGITGWQPGHAYAYVLTIDTYLKVEIQSMNINNWTKYVW